MRITLKKSAPVFHVALLALIVGIPILRAEDPLDKMNPAESMKLFDQMVEEKYRALSEDFEANPHFRNANLNEYRDGVESPFIEELYGFNWNNARKLTDRELKAIIEFHMPPYEVFRQAMVGYYNVVFQRPTDLKEKDLITVINFDEPTHSRRFYVFDLEKNKVLFNTYVAHGYPSDQDKDRIPETFSNTPGSNMSSLGFYLTATSLGPSPSFRFVNRIEGIDGALNDRARSRAILLHEWGPMEPSTMASRGSLPTTEGCFGLPAYVSGRFFGLEDEPLNDLIIKTISGKSLMYAYSSTVDLVAKSKYLNDVRAAQTFEGLSGFDGNRRKYERELKRHGRKSAKEQFVADQIKKAREKRAAQTPAPIPSPEPSPVVSPIPSPAPQAAVLPPRAAQAAARRLRGCAPG